MTKPKTNKLEDSKLWQDAVALTEEVYADAEAFSTGDNVVMTYKMRQKSFDLTSAIAEAEGSNSPRDIEWFYGQARTALFGIKNVYHVARKTHTFKVDPEEMVQFNKMIERIDKEIAKYHNEVDKLEAEEIKRRGIK